MAALAINPAVSHQPFLSMPSSIILASGKKAIVKPQKNHNLKVNKEMLEVTDDRTKRVGVSKGHSLYDLAVRQAPKGSLLALCQEQIVELGSVIESSLQERGNGVFLHLNRFKLLMLRSEKLYYHAKYDYLCAEAAALQRTFLMMVPPSKREWLLPTYKLAMAAMRDFGGMLGDDPEDTLTSDELEKVSEAMNAAAAVNMKLRKKCS